MREQEGVWSHAVGDCRPRSAKTAARWIQKRCHRQPALLFFFFSHQGPFPLGELTECLLSWIAGNIAHTIFISLSLTPSGFQSKATPHSSSCWVVSGLVGEQHSACIEGDSILGFSTTWESLPSCRACFRLGADISIAEVMYLLSYVQVTKSFHHTFAPTSVANRGLSSP